MENVKIRRRPNQDICVVLSERNIVLGVIQGESWNADPQARVLDVMQPGPRTFRPDNDPQDVLKVLRKADLDTGIVTTSDGELLGIFKAAQKKVQKTRKAA
jgi:Mg/Co/Ni transporter MgtE